ncbi:hypothetical protein GINT2_000437 [Glugoides intestinalis]
MNSLQQFLSLTFKNKIIFLIPIMLRNIKLLNKPLCIVENNGIIYVGDARGNILEIKKPFIKISPIVSAPGPISAICFHNRKLFYGTWDGIVYEDKKQMKLGINQIKCICVFEQKLFVSVDRRLVILDENLNTIEDIEVGNKIHCMDVSDGKIHFGMDMGIVSSYSDRYQATGRNVHEKTVLCMKNGVSGSCDCKIKENKNKTIFIGSSWTRAIHNHVLFSCGKDVIENGNVLYKHDDDVVGILKIDEKIISIGLDFSIKILESKFEIDEEEEKMLMEILKT